MILTRLSSLLVVVERSFFNLETASWWCGSLIRQFLCRCPCLSLSFVLPSAVFVTFVVTRIWAQIITNARSVLLVGWHIRSVSLLSPYKIILLSGDCLGSFLRIKVPILVNSPELTLQGGSYRIIFSMQLNLKLHILVDPLKGQKNMFCACLCCITETAY